MAISVKNCQNDYKPIIIALCISQCIMQFAYQSTQNFTLNPNFEIKMSHLYPVVKSLFVIVTVTIEDRD